MTDPHQMEKLREAQDAMRKKAIKESFAERLRRDELHATFWRWFAVGVAMFVIAAGVLAWIVGC